MSANDVKDGIQKSKLRGDIGNAIGLFGVAIGIVVGFMAGSLVLGLVICAVALGVGIYVGYR